MKRHYLFTLILALFAIACYDDKGNYDYKSLDEVTIELPQTSYQLYFNQTLEITPAVTTDIPEEDLAYYWEFYGKNPETQPWWDEYVPIDTAKVLRYVCKKDSVLLTGEGTYDLRLNVTQLSTNRHFYSETVKVTFFEEGIPVYLGAMVLHGNGQNSDIGLVIDQQFQMKEDTEYEQAVLPHYYSELNGESIPGAGGWLLEIYSSSMNMIARESIETIAVTDGGSALMDRTMVKTGEWNDHFYGGLNDNDPQNFVWNGTDMYAFDGEQVFYKQATKYTFTIPQAFVDQATGEETDWTFAPVFCFTDNGILGYEKNKRGFLSFSNVLGDVSGSFIQASGKVFNPADMNADLEYMAIGGANGHVLAVLRGLSGDYFMVELDRSSSVTAENTPLYRYDLSAISGQVIDWTFGEGFRNMCYYATTSGVYRFSVDGGTAISPEALSDMSHRPINFDGEITMAKILNPEFGASSSTSNYYYYNSNVLMVVGTYGGSAGSGKLYSMEIDQNSGLVREGTLKVYEGFDEIYDVNIKGY